jgi:FkbM family methyltransferase
LPPQPSSGAPPTDGRIRRLLAARRNYREEIRSIAASRPYVAFYGCGAILGSIVETWRDAVGRRIDFCSDSDPAKWGQTFAGIPCIAPSELAARQHETTVFVTIGDYTPVVQQLQSAGFSSVHLLYKYDLASAAYLETTNPEDVATNLESVRGMLADAQSVRVFDAIVDRVLDPAAPLEVMAEVFEGNQYFPDGLITLGPTEVFVDAGAYTGDTLADFLQRTTGCFEAVHCFELDQTNFALLRDMASVRPEASRITLHPVGLWQEAMEVSYSTEKSQSTIGKGLARGSVVRLDDVIGVADVSLLKMDIEGAELQALEGASRTIQTCRPKMAICVYHDFRHLWEVPMLLKRLVPDYRIFFRHHTRLEYETVCYAIPPEASCTS